jgi:hypothetical protein
VPIGVRHILVINSAPRIAGTRSLPLRGDDLMKLFVYLAFCSLDLESAAGDGEENFYRPGTRKGGKIWNFLGLGALLLLMVSVFFVGGLAVRNPGLIPAVPMR